MAENEDPPTGSIQTVKIIGQAKRRVLRPVSLMMLLTAAVLSFLVVSQLKGSDRVRQQLETESEGDLVRILASLSTESSALQQELAALKVDLANLNNSSQIQGTAAEQVSAQLRSLQVLSGTVPVKGPGLELAIEDPDRQVSLDVLVDAVQELRDAGAEALSINGRRIGATSSFGTKDSSITLDGVALPTPYELDAIGPQATMEGGLKIPGGSLDTLQALGGVHVDVHRSNNLQLPALEQTPTFRVARPASP